MHHSVYTWLIVVTWIVLVATIFLATISNLDNSFGIFQGTLTEFGRIRGVEPPPWVFFIIWPAIFVYQIIALIYATVNIFRRNSAGVPLYACAPFIHWSTFVAYIIGLLSATAWLFLNDRQILTGAAVVLVLSSLALYTTIAVSIYGIYRYYPLLAQNGFGKENRYVLGLMTNGIAMLGTWITLATQLALASALIFDAGIPVAASGAIVLSIITVEIMIWVLLDLAFLERFTRFLFTPYIVLVFGFSGIVSNDYDGNDPNTIFSIMLLIVASLMFCVKICLVIYREMKMPAFRKVVVPTTATVIYT